MYIQKTFFNISGPCGNTVLTAARHGFGKQGAPPDKTVQIIALRGGKLYREQELAIRCRAGSPVPAKIIGIGPERLQTLFSGKAPACQKSHGFSPDGKIHILRSAVFLFDKSPGPGKMSIGTPIMISPVPMAICAMLPTTDPPLLEDATESVVE